MKILGFPDEQCLSSLNPDLEPNDAVLLMMKRKKQNKLKSVLPKPSINRLIQHRLAEKDFVNKLNIRTTRYVSIEKKSEIETLKDSFNL